MKKLLIVSLFLLGLIGLFAQTPHLVKIDLQTEAGGYHPDNSVSFRAKESHPTIPDEQWAMFFPTNPLKEIYWHWNNADENINGFTSSYIGPDDPDTPGRLLIQAQAMNNFGMCNLNVWVKDADGNEYGPISVTKSATSTTQYPDVVAWGGPTGPEAPDWCTAVYPLAGAVNVPSSFDFEWANDDDTVLYDLYYRIVGAANWTNPLSDYNETSITVSNFAYATVYEWKVEPFLWADMPGGDKVYPEGEAPVWTFTTEDAPIVYPTWATYATPAEDAEGVAIDASLTWTYDGPAVDGYEVWVNGFEQGDVTEMEFVFPEDLNYNTEYTWGVVPFILEGPAPDKKASKGRPVAVKRYPEGHNYGDAITTWSFTTTASYETEVPTVIEGTPVTVSLVTVFTNPVPFDWAPNGPVAIGAPIIPLPPLAGAFQFGATIAQSVAGTFTYTFQIGATDFEGVLYVDGVQQFAGTFNLGTVIVTLNFTGAKDGHEVVVTEPTLPVELSSFTAVAHADEYVTLNWVTESESNLYGFNVYRAETDNQDQAIRINPTTVAPNNTTQTTNYSYIDNEVEATTYYYWLEVAELSNENTFHGPIVVTVEDDPVVPGITETTFRNFGPSPFTTSTSTTLRVKEGETASVTIYNLLGQVVRRESFNAGEHNFTFNGKDTNNKSVANGIYFVKMTSPTTSKSFKIVKIK